MTDNERIVQLEARLALLEARLTTHESHKPAYVPNPNWNDIQWYIPGNTPVYMALDTAVKATSEGTK